MTREALDSVAQATRSLKGFSAHAEESGAAGRGLRVVLAGRLDGEAANAAASPILALLEAWDGGPRIVVGLKDVQYMASMGIGLLARAAVAARKRGFTICLESPQPQVLKVLDLLGIPQYIPVVEADPGRAP